METRTRLLPFIRQSKVDLPAQASPEGLFLGRDSAPSDTIVPFLQNGEYGVTYAPYGNGEWLSIFQ